MPLTLKELEEKVMEHELDRLYTVVIIRDTDLHGKPTKKYFYINNDTFKTDDHSELFTEIQNLSTKLQILQQPLKVMVNTPGTMDYSPFLDRENFEKQNIEIIVHNQPNIGRNGNSTTFGALASAEQIKKNAKNNVVVIDELLKKIPHPDREITFFGLSMGTHHAAHLIQELQKKNADNGSAEKSLHQNDKIVLYFSHIPVFRKLGINFINRPDYLATQVFEALKDKNGFFAQLVKNDKFSLITFITQGERFVYHAPHGTIEFLQTLEQKIKTITDEEYKQQLLNILYNTTIVLDDYALQRFSQKGDKYFNDTVEFLHKFKNILCPVDTRIKEQDQLKNSKYLNKKLKNGQTVFDDLNMQYKDILEFAKEGNLPNVKYAIYYHKMSHIPTAVLGTVGVAGTTVGAIGMAGLIKNLPKKYGIILISVSSVILLISVAYGYTTHNFNKNIKNDVQQTLSNITNTSKENNLGM